MSFELETHRFDVDFEELQTFLIVARLRSFSRAAQHLHLSQPAVSHRIKLLEDKLMVRLLNRTTRALSLTPEGVRLQAEASVTLKNLQTLFQEFRGDALDRSGIIDIAATPTMTAAFLVPLIRGFNQDFPKIGVRLHDRMAEDTLDAVLDGSCDLAVMAYDTPRAGLRFRPLIDDPCALIAPPGHPLLERDSVSIEDVLRFPLICPLSYAPLREAIVKAARKRGTVPNFAAQAEGIARSNTIFAMAAAGVGVLLFPRHVIPREFEPIVGIRPISDCDIVRTFGIVTLARTPPRSPAKKFIRFLLDNLGTRGGKAKPEELPA